MKRIDIQKKRCQGCVCFPKINPCANCEFSGLKADIKASMNQLLRKNMEELEPANWKIMGYLK